MIKQQQHYSPNVGHC